MVCVGVVVFVCGLSKRVCVFVCGLLCDAVWYVSCAVLCVLRVCVLCGLCVIECAMVYVVLLLTGCAHVGVKETIVFVRCVWDVICEVVWFALFVFV